MSLARIYHTKKTQKVWTCSSCQETIPKGSACISFAVGFRGYDQRRCTKPECQPTRAQRESSLVADIYAEIDGADLNNAESIEDLEAIRDSICEVIGEVVQQYQDNPMYDNNYDMQERAEQLENSQSELEGWSFDEDEPEEEPECEDCDSTGNIDKPDPVWDNLTITVECPACDGAGKTTRDEDAYAEWLETAKASLQEAIGAVEIP